MKYLSRLIPPAFAVLAACQHSVKTPFPPGLEPLEDDAAPDPADLYSETLSAITKDTNYSYVYARGYVQVDPATVWAAIESPAPNVAICSTSSNTVDVNNDPTYEYSFLVHYTENNVVTVQWDDQWRFGTIDTSDFFGMIKHQKVQGSSFITLSEGTIQLHATTDPAVSELQFVEHLDATMASSSDVLKNVQHNYASLVSVSHGGPVTPCP
jgi:hypothetical protein